MPYILLHSGLAGKAAVDVVLYLVHTLFGVVVAIVLVKVDANIAANIPVTLNASTSPAIVAHEVPTKGQPQIRAEETTSSANRK